MSVQEDEMPELRSIPDLIEEMRVMAECCSNTLDPNMAKGIFEQCLSIMLEIRVPRMPETDEELAEMLASSESGPTFTTEEVIEHMRRGAKDFETFMEAFNRDIQGGFWTSAATRLLPSARGGGPQWSGDRIVNKVELADDGSGRTTLTKGASKVQCSAYIGGLSILGAIMLAHVEWHSIWKR